MQELGLKNLLFERRGIEFDVVIVGVLILTSHWFLKLLVVSINERYLVGKPWRNNLLGDAISVAELCFVS